MKTLWKFSCPSCGSPEQNFTAVGALGRVIRKNCERCGAKIKSELSLSKYVFMVSYINLIAALALAPMVIMLVAGRWVLALAFGALFFVLVWPPAMMIHARNAVALD